MRTSLLLLLLAASPAVADELSIYEKNAREFRVGQFKLGMDQSNLDFNFNTALGDRAYGRSLGDYLHFGKKVVGVVSYQVPYDADRYLQLYFQYGKLVAITIVREDVELSSPSALKQHQAKAIAKFGSDIYLKTGRDLTWQFPSVNRKVQYFVQDNRSGKQAVAIRVSLLHLDL